MVCRNILTYKCLFSSGYNRTKQANPGGLLPRACRDTIIVPTLSRARATSGETVAKTMAREAIEFSIEDLQEKGEEIPAGEGARNTPYVLPGFDNRDMAEPPASIPDDIVW